ncbi:HipA N-terminal domain-containing protein, partial [bacterium]|nr:HipA N-terminal domain-containing protein [bacterium]
MSEKQLSVRLYGNPIGVLKQDEAGKISFSYNPDASFAISHSLPLQTKPFEEKQCLPFFNGLLPENEETRKTLASMFRISATNDFSLLEAIGGDCAGALSFVPM